MFADFMYNLKSNCKMYFPDLEYRIDYQIRPGSFSNSYISMLTSHTSYWGNKDLAYFILTHLFPYLEDL